MSYWRFKTITIPVEITVRTKKAIVISVSCIKNPKTVNNALKMAKNVSNFSKKWSNNPGVCISFLYFGLANLFLIELVNQ